MSKVMVIVRRLRGNIIRTVSYCQRAPLQLAQLTKTVQHQNYHIWNKGYNFVCENQENIKKTYE